MELPGFERLSSIDWILQTSKQCSMRHCSKPSVHVIVSCVRLSTRQIPWISWRSQSGSNSETVLSRDSRLQKVWKLRRTQSLLGRLCGWRLGSRMKFEWIGQCPVCCCRKRHSYRVGNSTRWPFSRCVSRNNKPFALQKWMNCEVKTCLIKFRQMQRDKWP